MKPEFATARSSLPSPLKSPTATAKGPDPTAKLVAAPKLPVPVPSRTPMLLDVKLLFPTARSSLPSPLKSPSATERGFVPAAKLLAAVKLGVPHCEGTPGASLKLAVAFTVRLLKVTLDGAKFGAETVLAGFTT